MKHNEYLTRSQRATRKHNKHTAVKRNRTVTRQINRLACLGDKHPQSRAEGVRT